MNEEDLREWQSNPTTRLLRRQMIEWIEDNKEQQTLAYWGGTPLPEERRRAILMVETLVDLLFNSTVEDINGWLGYTKETSE